LRRDFRNWWTPSATVPLAQSYGPAWWCCGAYRADEHEDIDEVLRDAAVVDLGPIPVGTLEPPANHSLSESLETATWRFVMGLIDRDDG